MINFALFRPYNFAVIALVVLLWMFLLGKAKSRLDSPILNSIP